MKVNIQGNILDLQSSVDSFIALSNMQKESLRERFFEKFKKEEQAIGGNYLVKKKQVSPKAFLQAVHEKSLSLYEGEQSYTGNEMFFDSTDTVEEDNPPILEVENFVPEILEGSEITTNEVEEDDDFVEPSYEEVEDEVENTEEDDFIEQSYEEDDFVEPSYEEVEDEVEDAGDGDFIEQPYEDDSFIEPDSTEWIEDTEEQSIPKWQSPPDMDYLDSEKLEESPEETLEETSDKSSSDPWANWSNDSDDSEELEESSESSSDPWANWANDIEESEEVPNSPEQKEQDTDSNRGTAPEEDTKESEDVSNSHEQQEEDTGWNWGTDSEDDTVEDIQEIGENPQEVQKISINEKEKSTEEVENNTQKGNSESTDLDNMFEEIDVSEELSNISKPEKKEIVEEKEEVIPKDLRSFIKQHPNCEMSLALKYFSRKEIDKQLSLGRVFKRKNKLMI